MLGDDTAHRCSWVLSQPALPDTEPEEADHSLELLLAGKLLVLPLPAPFGQIAGVEIPQELEAYLIRKVDQLRLEDMPQLLQCRRREATRLRITEMSTASLTVSRVFFAACTSSLPIAACSYLRARSSACSQDLVFAEMRKRPVRPGRVPSSHFGQRQRR